MLAVLLFHYFCVLLGVSYEVLLSVQCLFSLAAPVKLEYNVLFLSLKTEMIGLFWKYCILFYRRFLALNVIVKA